MARGPSRNPTVIDLFCGAGGFSEGFRQAGFEVVAGFDSWKDAQQTFKHNFPMAIVGGELTEGGWKKLKKDFGKVDVVIGGPPCVEFSSSNWWGNGDVKNGLRHVQLFLDYIDYLKPEYWVMENVPRLERVLSKEIENRDLRVPKGFDGLPFRKVLNSKDFGVPQRRERLFTSNLDLGPLGDNRMEEPKTLGGVIDSLNCKERIIEDYNYPYWKGIKKEELADYYEFLDYVKLNAIQLKRCEKLKLYHGFAGKIAFPDKQNEPSRTIMATQTFSSRETIIVNVGRRSKYRSLTVRENASLQGFPINFQFHSPYIGNRYKLVGNAVPVGLARAIANKIRCGLGLQRIQDPISKDYKVQPSERLQPRTRKRMTMGKWFHWHPPGSLVSQCRVDLDNRAPPKRGSPHECRWDAVLHVGQGRQKHRKITPGKKEIWGALQSANLDKKKENALLEYVRTLHGALPDATTLLWAHMYPTTKSWKEVKGIKRPDLLIEEIDKGCSKAIGRTDERVDCRDHIKICPDDGLPLATLVCLFAVHWACIEINECMGWAYRNKDLTKWEGREFILKKNVKRGGCKGVRSKRFPKG